MTRARRGLMGIWNATAGALHPATLPLMARRSYALEFASISFFSIAVACVEGGVISVFAKQSFAGVVGLIALNFAVALLGAAPDVANILSFFWIQLAHGRRKVRFINGLQAGLIACVAAFALLPMSGVGLVLAVVLALAARTCWSGIITLRPTIWRANYDRACRARIVSKIWTGQVVVVAIVGGVIGLALDRDPDLFRIIFPAAAASAILSIVLFSRVRVRRESASLQTERRSAPTTMAPWHGFMTVFRVLGRDVMFAKFMTWMFVLGFGNLMLIPILVITLKDQFGFEYLKPILIISTVPSVVMIVAMPLWARLLDRAHIVRFRSLHSWSFVLSQGTFMLAVWLNAEPLLYAGALLQGVGFGGGALAWNLGHVDFAPPDQTSLYMATHVTLTGIRGIIAPLSAVGLYNWLNSALAPRVGDAAPHHAAVLVLLLSCGFCVAGGLGFVALRRSMGAAIAGEHRRA